jgi:hypothetical protein
VARNGRIFNLRVFILNEPLALCGEDYPTAYGSENELKNQTVDKKIDMYKPDFEICKTKYSPIPIQKKHFKVDKKTLRASLYPIEVKLNRQMGMAKFDTSEMSTDDEHFVGIAKEAKGMTKIRTKRVRWDSSTSPDVAGYKLYWAIGQGVNYDSDFAEMGNVTEVILPDDVPSFPRVAGDIEIGVTAVNYRGNESDMSVFSAPFDFTAPEAPLNLVVEDT